MFLLKTVVVEMYLIPAVGRSDKVVILQTLDGKSAHLLAWSVQETHLGQNQRIVTGRDSRGQKEAYLKLTGTPWS
jgi:hypothetical protein